MRKSRELRLSQSVQLLEACSSVGLANDYRMRFVRDMISRLERGKGLSKKQRNWLDNLIEDGAPQPQGDPKLLKEIQDAAALDGMQHRVSVLQDFAGNVVRGNELSGKQKDFLDAMLKEAEHIRQNGKFRPSDIPLLQAAASILSHKGAYYFAHRGGTAKALRTVSTWLEWSVRNEAHQLVMAEAGAPNPSDYPLPDEPRIDEWSCNKVLEGAKGPLRELTDGKHPVGSMRYRNIWAGNRPAAIVVSEPRVNEKNGAVVQDLLVNGDVEEVNVKDIRKRR
tara:strand:+ start:8751 stop:9590 length:840 start_codon:yes stop_codon:yes gene_type:complete